MLFKRFMREGRLCPRSISAQPAAYQGKKIPFFLNCITKNNYNMQVYHSNARKNIHIRLAIKQSNLPMKLFAKKYQLSENTSSQKPTHQKQTAWGERANSIIK